ncbi:filamentous hemagglutinin N-terminal domain-containing protein, partial [Polynucleobacter sp. AP-Reno-20A-A9]|uniref:two-partner secretion domain-containing protein n=1 Tax=Polynucleobacter sp. AP-Reno-20A-A9 TaxID=2576925 RepID=UPI001C0DAF94
MAGNLFIGIVAAANPTVPNLPSALPTNGRVVAGNAAISQTQTPTTAAMTVNQTSQRAVVNWDSFNVGKNASVTFNQPNANAVTLNRVTGATASMIEGAVKANGQVVFVNPNGVTFGKGAEINAAGVVATTMDISNKDFMDGKSTYKGNGRGSVINEGKISTNTEGGYIALLAPEVRNDGYLLAKKGSGTVAMAAGEQITLDFKGNSLISVKVDVGTYNALIENKRVVEVNGGLVVIAAGSANQLMASVIKNTGRISASSMVNNGGVIELVANTVTQAGKVTANSKTAEGGQINIVGNDITIAQNSKTTATGATNGGQVNIGLASTQVSGGTQVNAPTQAGIKANTNQAAQNKQLARTVTIEQDALIDTSSTSSGNGGAIAIWSEVKTTVAGILKSMGGAISGNGGFIETSSKGTVNLTPTASINTSATNGKAGTWLLDPIDLTIDATTASLISAVLANSNVTIEVTSNTNTCPIGSCTQNGTGSLTIASGADILKAGTNLTTLTLSSAGIFNLNANISGQNLSVIISSSIAYLNVGSSITASEVTVQAQTIYSAGSIQTSNYLANTGNTLGNAIKLLAQAIYVSGGLTLNANLPVNGATTITVNGVAKRPDELPAYLTSQNADQSLNRVYSTSAANDSNSLQIAPAQSNVIYLTGSTLAELQSFAMLQANGTTGGSIFISAPTISTQAGSVVQANGNNGPGGVIAFSGDQITVAGNIAANGSTDGGAITLIANNGDLIIQNSVIQTNGGAGRGGSFGASANNNVTITSSAIEATGYNQGGSIKIGNDASNGTLPFALSTTLDQYTTLNASQLDPNQSNLHGGLIETSGGTLSLLSSINAGRGGIWLIDPYDLIINDAVADTINTALNASTNVQISTPGAGNISIRSAINATSGSATLTFTSTTIELNTNVATLGAQTYNGDVVLGASVTLTAGNDSTVLFNGNINAASSGIQSLTINVGTGAVTFGGSVGATTPLSSLSVNNGGSSVVAGNVTTTGPDGQNYGGNLSLAASDITLSSGTGPVSIAGNVVVSGALTKVIQFLKDGSYVFDGSLTNPGNGNSYSNQIVDGGLLSFDLTISTFTWTPAASLQANYLVVAGGGGGAGNGGGGGGGGGVLISSAAFSGATSYQIAIGAGGSGGMNSPGASGGSSSISGSGFTTIYAYGGGRGGYSQYDPALSGGSGGGGSFGKSGALGTPGQGNSGSSGINTYVGSYTGGGGGAGGAAGMPYPISLGYHAGDGGAGIASSLTGAQQYYGAGGGGAGSGIGEPGIGGSGVGGNGSTIVFQPGGNAIGYGNGGGGGTSNGNGYGGRGSDGIVVLSYSNSSSRLTINSSNASSSISGSIHGNISLALDGSGTLNLSGANTYMGATNIARGATLSLSGTGSIANSSAVNVDGVFDISKASAPVSIKSLNDLTPGAGYGVASLGSNTLTIGSDAGAGSFSGVIQDDVVTGGNIVITGNGYTQTLSGVNTYIGNTYIVQGVTLALVGAGSIANSSAVIDNGIFDISGAGSDISIQSLGSIDFVAHNQSLSSVLLGSNNLLITNPHGGDGYSWFYGNIRGSGGVTISSVSNGSNDIWNSTAHQIQVFVGSNEYSGPTIINVTAGLYLWRNGGIANSSSVTNDGILFLDGNDWPKDKSYTLNNLTGSNTGVITGSGVLTIRGNNTNYAGIIQDEPSPPACCSPQLSVIISSGTQTLSGANTYTGSTTISNGTLIVTSLADGGVASSVGMSSSDAANLIFNGGTLQYVGSGPISTDRLFTITALGGTINGSGVDSSSIVNFTSQGNIALSGAGSRTFIFTGSALNNQFHPTIPDTDGSNGITTVDQTGIGSWILPDSSTIRISSGLVDLSALSSKSVIIMSGDATLDLLGQSLTIAKITGGAGNTITNSIAGSQVYLTLIGTTLGNFSGVIQDGSGISLGLILISSSNNGTLILSGSNTYSASTYITRGVLAARSASALGASSVIIGGAGKLDLQYSGTVTLSSSLRMVGSSEITNSVNISNLQVRGNSVLAGSVTTSGNQSYEGTVTLAANTMLTSSDSITFSSTVDSIGSSPYSLIIHNNSANTTFGSSVGATYSLNQLSISGNVLLGGDVNTQGDQTYSGNVTLTAENISLNSNALGIDGGGSSGAVVINGLLNQISASRLFINSGSGKVSIFGNIADLEMLSITSSNTENTVAGIISGATSFAFSGSSGVLTLTGANTYTGTTLIDQGATLALKGAGKIDYSSSVDVTGTLDIQKYITISALAVHDSGSIINSTGSPSSLTVRGLSVLANSVETYGDQTYLGPVTLAKNTYLSGDAVYFYGTVDGKRKLFIDSFLTVLMGDVGSINPLRTLKINAAIIDIVGNVRTSGNQTYSAWEVLVGDPNSSDARSISLVSRYGNIKINAAIDDISGCADCQFFGVDYGSSSIPLMSTSLTLRAQNIVLNDHVGYYIPLSQLKVFSANPLDLKVSVTTLNLQQYAAPSITLGQNVTLNGLGGTISFITDSLTTRRSDSIFSSGGTLAIATYSDIPINLGWNDLNNGGLNIRMSVLNGQERTVFGWNGFDAYEPFANFIIGNQEYQRDGPIYLNRSINNQNGASFTFNSPVVLLRDAAISSYGGSITFNDTINSYDDITPYSLTLNAGRGECLCSVIVNKKVGGINPLLQLTIEANDTYLAANVKTIWNQNYSGNLWIGQADNWVPDFVPPWAAGKNIRLQSDQGNINFYGKVGDAGALVFDDYGPMYWTDGVNSLTVKANNGAVYFNKAVGSNGTALDQLTIEANDTYLAANVKTIWNQNYSGNLWIGQADNWVPDFVPPWA